MTWGKKTHHVTGKGSYIEFVDTGWDAEFISYSIENETREANDVTHTRSPNGYMEHEPGGFVNPGTIEVTFHYDPSNPPPTRADVEEIRMVFVKPDDTDRFVLTGPGFVTSGGGGDVPEAGGRATATLTIQKAGGWSIAESEPTEAL